VSLEKTLQEIERSFGSGSIVNLCDKPVQVDAISTGSLGLDIALGVGGMPRGRIIEVFGPESAGKSTLVLHILANAQKLGLRCAFIDAEHSLDPAYAAAIGVDVDSLLISQPASGEEALEITSMLVASGGVGVVAIDSVAALTPQSEIDGEMGQQGVGQQARLMSRAMRKLAAPADRTQTLLLFTNQIREKVGVMFGSPETTPGGRALRFYATQRIDLRRIQTLKDGETAIGQRVRAKVVKNKVASPYRTAEFDITYGQGIDIAGELLDLGVELGQIKKSGSWYTIAGQRSQGKPAARQALTAPLMAEIREKALA